MRGPLGGSNQGISEKNVIRALICDLDNTLFAARTIPRTTMQPAIEAVRAANRVGTMISAASLDQAFEACWDRSFDEVARLYALPETLCRAWEAAAEQLEVTEQLELYPDVAVLWSLPLRLFLVTTGYRRFQESKIRALGLMSRFEAIYVDALGDSPRAGKEALFRRLLVERDLAATDVAVLGDSADSELAAGIKIGLRTIQILRDGVIPASSAHWRIQSLNELPRILAGISVERAAT